LLLIFYKIPFSDISQNLFRGYGYLAGLWLLSAPLVGIGFLFVHKISWYVFLCHSSLILIDYVYKWATKPLLYWQNVANIHNFLMLTGNVILVVIIGYIIQKDFRAPYFQALPRSWRESSRIPINHVISINGELRKVDDLSSGGCFIPEPELVLNLGDKISVFFKSDTLDIECEGEIRRKSPEGYGIQFIALPVKKRRDITRMLKQRFSLRYEVNFPCKWTFNDKNAEGKMLNISRGGCYIQTVVEGLEKDMFGEILCEINSQLYITIGNIVWINRKKEHEKPIGFGIKFLRKQIKLMNLIIEHFGERKLIR
jgi:hypothetical protein